MKDQTVEPYGPGHRAAAYWFADGLPQLVLGLAIDFSAVLGILVWRVLAPNPQFFHGAIMAAGFLLYAWLGRRAIEELKSRLTYPRTGYAKPPEEIDGPPVQTLTSLNLEPRRRMSENVTSFEKRTGMVIFFALMGTLGGAPNWFVTPWLAVLAAALYVFNRNSVHPYRWWSVAALPLMGAPFLWVKPPAYVHEWLALLLSGIWLTAFGGIKLLQYLRANPGPAAREARA